MRTRILLVATIAAIGGTIVAVAAAPAAKAPKPAKPTVATKAVTSLADTSVTLNGTVNPKGSQTSFQFQYGTTNTYGSTTGLVSAGSGNANAPVTANVTGLTANTTYHYRLVATNAQGTSMTGDKTFKTLLAGQQAAGLSLSATPNPVRYGANTTLSGKLTGPTVANQQVTLQQNPFPFTGGGGGFKNVGAAVNTDAQGNFTFPAMPLTINTQFRATSGRNTTSPVVTVNDKVIVGLSLSKARVRKGRKVRFSGTVTPAEDGALYAIQRRSNGRWLTVAGGALAHNATTPTTSTYSKRVTIRHGGTYRVFVKVTEGGHVSNTSRTRRITLLA
jgi:hypothetical protein